MLSHLRFIFTTTTCSNTLLLFFSSNATATTEIYTLSLHDALPISLDHAPTRWKQRRRRHPRSAGHDVQQGRDQRCERRSEEHTSELQSLTNLVCRLLLEKKKKKTNKN